MASPTVILDLPITVPFYICDRNAQRPTRAGGFQTSLARIDSRAAGSRGEIEDMTRKVQGVLLGVGILVAVVFILGAADAGDSSRCSAQGLKWLGCVLAAHEGLAGGLIGAGGAIFAGWLAWSGVRDQIKSERELATASQRDNLAAILAEMRDLFDLLNQVWRAIDIALLPDQSAEDRAKGISMTKSIFFTLPQENQIGELKDFTDELAKEIAPTKRGQFIRVWQSIDWIYRDIQDDSEEAPANDDGSFRLHIIRIQLSHFERYLLALDEPSGRAFAPRTRRDVDHRGIAAQIRPMVDGAERGEIP